MKYLKSLIILFFILFSLLPADNEISVIELLQKNELEKARKIAWQQWKSDPENIKYTGQVNYINMLQTADEHYLNGEYQLADNIYKKIPITYLAPKRMDHLNMIFDLKKKILKETRAKHNETALVHYKEILKINPADKHAAFEKEQLLKLSASNNEAFFFIIKGDWQKAKEHYHKIWERNPQDTKIYQIIDTLKLVMSAEKDIEDNKLKTAIIKLEKAKLVFEDNLHIQSMINRSHKLIRLEKKAEKLLSEQKLNEATRIYKQAMLLSNDNKYFVAKYSQALKFKGNIVLGKTLLLEHKFENAYKVLKANQEVLTGDELNNELLLVAKTFTHAIAAKDPTFDRQYIKDLKTYTQLKAKAFQKIEKDSLIKKEINIAENIINNRNKGYENFYDGNYPLAQKYFFEVMKINPLDKKANLYYNKSIKAEKLKKEIQDNVKENNFKEAWKLFYELEKLNSGEVSSTYQLPAAM